MCFDCSVSACVCQQVLNVSFSVRQRVSGGVSDVFYSQEFLRERVYLQRTLLTTMSTLEVCARHCLCSAGCDVIV